MITPVDLQHRASPVLARQIGDYTPRSLLGQSIFRSLRYLPDELGLELVELLRQTTVMESALGLTVIRADGRVELLGIVGRKMVTDAGVQYIVDAFQNLLEVENFKYHGIGTGAGAEAVGNTALSTELTTQYNPDNTRATGSLTEGASANIFRTVGTNTVDSAVSITEHGIFTQAATGGGTLLDKTLFTAVALGIGDSLQSTYDLTVASGG